MSLFPDQTELIQKVRQAMMHHKRVLIMAETGFGKTFVACEMIARCVSAGKKAIFVVPRKTLLYQTSKTLDSFGIRHGFITSGSPYNKFCNVYVATTRTLTNMIKKGNVLPSNLVIYDEVHFSIDESAQSMEFFLSKGAWILGMTATPIREDGRGLGRWFDVMVEGPSMSWLIQNKRLSDYVVYGPKLRPNLSGIRTVNGDFSRSKLDERMKSQRFLISDSAEKYKKIALGKLNKIYCTSVSHAEIVADEFNSSGIPAAAVSGKTSDEVLKKIIKAFANRELLALASCDLCIFGFDLSSYSGVDVTIECITDLDPTKSLQRQRQKNGRGMRYKDDPLILLDSAGNCFDADGYPVHGFPDDEIEWTLDDRLHGVGTKGGERILPVKQCLSDANGAGCFHCHHPAPKCPKCGHVYEVQSREIEEVEGELEAIDKERLKREKKKEVWKAKSLDELKAIERERGYKPGWAMIQAKIRGIA